MIKFVFIPDKNRNAFTKMFLFSLFIATIQIVLFNTLLVIEFYSKKFLRLHSVCVAKQVSVCLTSMEMTTSFLVMRLI